jgi:lipopolysaccharide transport system ATP-binding protein
MSDDIAISIRGLGKKYKIGGPQEEYHTFRDAIVNSVKGPFRRFTQQDTSQSANEFWALKDVSFEVHKGEVIGIIGRNGAGKSTLLKILSQITTPTEGEVDIFGRVGSLLEVGTGFHPELTGRENIFLSGSILGMRKREIEGKFDEIVKFAEIDKFIDTPVKRYSSGMYVRLAFAVAAHLDPEILVIDEVLAVGDAGFQKKCLGKMGEISQEGRTVLFVSHNMAAVQNLCMKGIVLESGKIIYNGPMESAISSYLQSNFLQTQSINLYDRKDRRGNNDLKFYNVKFYNENNKEISQLISGDYVILRFYYKSNFKIDKAHVHVAFNISTQSGILISNLNSIETGDCFINIYFDGFFECIWEKVNLRSGIYQCNLFCSVNQEVCDHVQSAFILDIVEGDFFGSGKISARRQGDIFIDHKWKSEKRVDQ